MTLGFLSGSKNFCKLLWVSCEVFVLHGYAWIHWVAKSCTTTAYRWMFRDSQLSLRTLWSAVIKFTKFFSTKYSSTIASSAWSPCILVRLQISQFRSLGKWEKLCWPNSSRLFVVGSKETSWEELAWEPPCNGISSSTKLSLNSCSYSGISESDGLLRSIGVSFLLVFGFLLAWLSSGHPDLSSTVVDTCTGEMSLSIWSSRSRVWTSLTVGEEDELVEDDEQWLSCLEGVPEVDEDAEEELDKPGNTIGTKFSVCR